MSPPMIARRRNISPIDESTVIDANIVCSRIERSFPELRTVRKPYMISGKVLNTVHLLFKRSDTVLNMFCKMLFNVPVSSS